MISNELVIKSIDYIMRHLDEEISIEDVSRYCYLSKYYFSRIFKAETGESMYAFIKRLKMEQSAFKLKVAKEIVYGKNETAKTEDNPTWVKSTMNRLERHFDNSTVKQIRMYCQCGYGMDERIELVKELVEASSNMDELGRLDKAKAAGLYCENGELYLQFMY